MRQFAKLIDNLIYTRSRNAKLALIADYLKSTLDPHRGWALAALTDGLDFSAVKSSTIRTLAQSRIDPQLFKLSRDHVGDTAETVALIWPGHGEICNDPTVDEVVNTLHSTTRMNALSTLGTLLDTLDAESRYAMLKLATGGMRVGVSARLAKVAFAKAFAVSVDQVEEYWHAFSPPYTELFAWADHNAEPPDLSRIPYFRPFMLAHPLEDTVLNLADYVAEWKWDGIRVQLCRTHGETRMYSRGGEEISASFPDIVSEFKCDGVVDGELMVRGDYQGGEAASFNALQQRLGRKKVSNKMLEEAPAFVRLYDIMVDGKADVRLLAWTKRRAILEHFVKQLPKDRFDLSNVIEADSFEVLENLRDSAREAAIEGLMLKRRDGAYLSGRRTGQWYKWKRDPLVADCVMMYAQRGNGRRASFFSDYTFGCWNDRGELLPVGKAYSGFTDEELKWLDTFVRSNTIKRYGPVREVKKSLVLEVAFDSIHKSRRHKSGLAMRFPRIVRIRKDKPAEEADIISTLQKMVS